MAKLIFSVALLSGSSFFMALIIVVLLKLPTNLLLYGSILGIPGLVGACALSLMIDTLWPKLDWDNPQPAMKGNFNVMIALIVVAALGFGMFQLLMSGVKNGLSSVTLLWLTGGALALFSALGVFALMRVGPGAYTQERFGLAKKGTSNRQ